MKARIASVVLLTVATIFLAAPGASATTVLQDEVPSADSGLAGVSSVMFPQWRRWPSPVIRYHNRYRAIGDLVADAAKAWNTSGARIRWQPVPLKRAQVVIRRAEMKDLAGWAGPDRTSTPDRSIPPIGSIHGSVIKIDPSVLELARTPNRAWPRYESAERISARQVLVHEMGHMLGLAHHKKQCSVMNVPMFSSCPEPPKTWEVRCGLLAKDDVRGAIRLFGGKARVPKPAFCPVEGPPDPVTDFRVEFVPQDPLFDGKPSIHPGWRMPAKNLPAKVSLRWGSTDGDCPQTPLAGSGGPPSPVGRTSPGKFHSYASNQTFAPGTYCFSLFSLTGRGTAAAEYSTATVTFGAEG